MSQRVKLDAVAPIFSLQDFRGNRVSLADYSGKKHVFLVFNRGFA